MEGYMRLKKRLKKTCEPARFEPVTPWPWCGKSIKERLSLVLAKRVRKRALGGALPALAGPA